MSSACRYQHQPPLELLGCCLNGLNLSLPCHFFGFRTTPIRCPFLLKKRGKGGKRHHADIKQLSDEVEHDIVNYQNRGLCYRRLRQITQTQGFDNSRYHAKTEFSNCFIVHFSNNLQTNTNSATLFDSTTGTEGLETRRTLNST